MDQVIATPVVKPTDFKSVLRDYFDLSKPGIGFYSLITTFTAFWMASSGKIDLMLLFHTIMATGLVTAGGGALNQVIEIQADSEMRRTEKRPLPAGRVSALSGLVFGVVTSILGTAYLLFAVNALSALLAIGTLVGYLFVYTPSKKLTSLSTIIGAFPGAIPILIGWVAVTGSIDLRGWTLFGILFLWQIPHFLAIAWMYRKDYARAGFPMLTVIEPEGISAAHQSVIYLIALLPISLMPTELQLTGQIYFIGAVILGIGFLASGVVVAIKRSNTAARQMLFASIIYLPVLLVLMIIDKM
ncbi:MAG: heme o synthase [Bacteroidota bacterium]|nr:heme o synthase [Bacteroidota bacterium]MDP4230467.1 heme o synthase [Bacteroidota bacterium]MDP4237080.1 heme o synthase [Bacteroidota bacterium]